MPTPDRAIQRGDITVTALPASGGVRVRRVRGGESGTLYAVACPRLAGGSVGGFNLLAGRGVGASWCQGWDGDGVFVSDDGFAWGVPVARFGEYEATE